MVELRMSGNSETHFGKQQWACLAQKRQGSGSIFVAVAKMGAISLPPLTLRLKLCRLSIINSWKAVHRVKGFLDMSTRIRWWLNFTNVRLCPTVKHKDFLVFPKLWANVGLFLLMQTLGYSLFLWKTSAGKLQQSGFKSREVDLHRRNFWKSWHGSNNFKLRWRR